MKLLKIIQFLLLMVTFSIGQQMISNVHTMEWKDVSIKGSNCVLNDQEFGIEEDLIRLISSDDESQPEGLLLSGKPEDLNIKIDFQNLN